MTLHLVFTSESRSRSLTCGVEAHLVGEYKAKTPTRCTKRKRLPPTNHTTESGAATLTNQGQGTNKAIQSLNEKSLL